MTESPHTLTTEQCELLLEKLLCRDGTPKQQQRGIRNYTIALVMLDAGLRVGELVQLNKSSLWFNGQPVTTIFVPARISHSSAERHVPLTAKLTDAVNLMQLNLWSTLSSLADHWAFYSVRPTRPLSERQVQHIINGGSLKSLGRSINPHSLRHTFGTRLMRTTNARIVQVLLGHKHLSSTQIYTHPNQQDLTTAIASLEPSVTK